MPLGGGVTALVAQPIELYITRKTSETCGEKKRSSAKMQENQIPKFFNTERVLCGFSKLTKLAPEKNWASETCGEKKPTWRNLRQKKLELRKDAGKSNPKTFLYRADFAGKFSLQSTISADFSYYQNLPGNFFELTKLAREKNQVGQTCRGKKHGQTKLPGKFFRVGRLCSTQNFPCWTLMRGWSPRRGLKSWSPRRGL